MENSRSSAEAVPAIARVENARPARSEGARSGVAKSEVAKSEVERRNAYAIEYPRSTRKVIGSILWQSSVSQS
jgi:hypothetical protein